jgi:hypothetical protein
MPRAYSRDLRQRVVAAVLGGGQPKEALTSAEVVGIRGARRRAGATPTSLAQARRRLAARVVIGPLG